MSSQQISIEDAQKLAQNESVVWVDIRDPRSYQAAHIPGAEHLTDDTVQAFLQRDKSVPVIVNCYHGNSSQNAAAFLANQGFTAYSLIGGFGAWSAAGLETESA